MLRQRAVSGRRRTRLPAGGQLCMGLCCERGRGVPVDKAAAAAWYRKGAEQEDEECSCCLGYL